MQSNVVMLVVVVIVLATHNLALGVFVGVLLSALFLINKLENEVKVSSIKVTDQHRIYQVSGQIFFSSSDKFFQFFNFNEDIQFITIDLTHAHIWDITSVSMLNTIKNKFESSNIHVEILGLNESSHTLIDRMQSKVE